MSPGEFCSITKDALEAPHEGTNHVHFTVSLNPWTPTGLCAQTNNTIVRDNAKAAQRYLDYWKQLRADTQQAKDDPKALQGDAFRGWDAAANVVPIRLGGTLASWFSPYAQARGALSPLLSGESRGMTPPKGGAGPRKEDSRVIAAEALGGSPV